MLARSLSASLSSPLEDELSDSGDEDIRDDGAWLRTLVCRGQYLGVPAVRVTGILQGSPLRVVAPEGDVTTSTSGSEFESESVLELAMETLPDSGSESGPARISGSESTMSDSESKSVSAGFWSGLGKYSLKN